jgi:anti-sigma factor RsiW
VNQHYSEADLLETYYAQPGASMPVMMHLADCDECAARYERLEKKVRALSACDHDKAEQKPETFWARQRISVMRKIDARRDRASSMARLTRVAAVAVFAVALGVLGTWRLVKPVAESPSRQVVQTLTAPVTSPLEESATRNLEDSPWQSDELSDYQSMVAWESWVDNGDQSL